MSQSPTIRLNEIYAAVRSELDDCYTDGLISAAIYNKKSPKRLLLYAINQADIHICLNLKISSYVFVYVPADQKVVFFARQKENRPSVNSQYSEIQTDDGAQYAYLTSETNYLDIVSANSPIAIAFGQIPTTASATGIALWNAQAPEVMSQYEDYHLQTKTGTVYDVTNDNHRFYIDARERKMVLDRSFSEDKYVLLHAQIAPVSLQVTNISKTDLDNYDIRSPYYTRQWLIHRALTHILPNKAATESGYFELEAKYRAEAIANEPGTGNIILTGPEMSGNYESSFDM